MNISLVKENVAYLILSIIISLLSIYFILFEDYSYLSISATILNIIFIFKFKKTIPIFILFVFILLYTNTFNYFFISNYYLSVWPDFQTQHYFKYVLINHFVFILFLGNLISVNKYSNLNFDIEAYFKPNNYLYYFFIFCFFIFLYLGIKGENIFISGIYADSESMKKTTFHEYSILLYLFILIYSPRVRRNFLINTLLLIIFIFKTLLFGGRIEVIQIFLLYFYFYYVFQAKVSYRYVILFSMTTFFLLHIFGNIRNNPSILLFLDYNSIFDFTNLFQIETNKLYIDSNQGDVIQSSARMFGLIENGYLPFPTRLFSFLLNIFSSILPPFLLPDFSNLSIYKQDIYNSGGGGLISTYFFVWFGYIGPVIASLILSYFIKKFYTTGNRYILIYSICIFITFPRWFAYNPIHLFKFCIYAVILYWIVNKFIDTRHNENINKYRH